MDERACTPHWRPQGSKSRPEVKLVASWTAAEFPAAGRGWQGLLSEPRWNRMGNLYTRVPQLWAHGPLRVTGWKLGLSLIFQTRAPVTERHRSLQVHICECLWLSQRRAVLGGSR